MSDDLKDDFPGATKGLFASVGLMLLFVGGDMIAEREGLRLGLGFFLVLIGCASFYTAFFWQTAKKALSAEAQLTITNFSKNRNTWLGVMFLLFQTLILSRFVDQHRWPFSYPADPQIETDNKFLRDEIKQDAVTLGMTIQQKNSELNIEREAANKWRFSSRLRSVSADGNNSTCLYQFVPDAGTRRMFVFWEPLFRAGAWKGSVSNNDAPDGSIQPGITIRTGANSGVGFQCASELQKALSDIYPDPPSRVAIGQTTDYLNACGQSCMQIEIAY